MISLLAGLIWLVWFVRAGRRNLAFLLVIPFLGWQFLLKVFGTVYLDVFGPVFAKELQTEVGGVGSSAPLMVLFVFIPMGLIYWFLRRRPNARLPLPERRLDAAALTLGDVVVWLMLLFLVALFVDMFARGNIPLFTGLDRFEYKGGVFHQLFTNYIFLVTFVLGFAFVRCRILTGAWDLRCVLLLLGFFVYLVMAGHRFGAFYVMASFGALALSAFPYMQLQGWAVAPPATNRSFVQKVVRSRVTMAAGAMIVAVLVGGALLNNLLNVRAYGSEAGSRVTDRLLIEPVHLYWLTYERLHDNEIEGAGAAIDFMFGNPIDAARNTGIQYLMFLSLGEKRAEELVLDAQLDFAGGYPEIIIELGGVWIALGLALLASVVLAALYRLCVVSICRGHFLTALMSIYVCYGFLSVYLGGMLNFFLAWTYWAKVALLIIFATVDRVLDHYGHRLLPWVLVRRARRLAPARS